MSACDTLREVMSCRHDRVEDPDTDAVSTTTTVSDPEECFYDAQCIIGEDPEKQNPYLVKWEAYPLDQCTWEPSSHLDGTRLIADWVDVRKELGEASFQKTNEKNIAAYREAQKRAEAARERRLEKRERKRGRFKRKNRSTTVFDDDSSEEEPMASVRRNSAHSESLFVKDSEPSAANVPRTRHEPLVRKAPLRQSSSEEESDSDDHALDKQAKAHQKSKRRAANDLLDQSTLKPKLNKKTEERSNTGVSTASNARNQEHEAVKKGRASTSSAHGFTEQQMVGSAVPKKPTRQREPAIASSSFKARSTTLPSTNSKSTNAMRAIRTAPSKQTSRAINIIDKPLDKQRKEWSTNNRFNTVRYHFLAGKRSRNEGVPDFNALEFVNGPPPTLPKLGQAASSGNPYGRREITNRRVQEEEDDLDDRRRQGAPLADWETEKVPLMCASWRLSSNCPFDAKKCPFMHRETDPRGELYSTGDLNGRIPQKYRKPPITCPFWYKGGKCTKSAELCQYAHEDTGWAELNGEPIQIALLPSALNEATAWDPPQNLVPYKLQNPPITCSFWLRAPQGCNKTDEECKYAHRNTGWAPPEDDIKGRPVQIDPNLRPRKRTNKDITCPFWLRGEHGCVKSEGVCKFAHRNTGWILQCGEGGGQPVEIESEEGPRYHEPMLKPASREPKNTNPPITCSFWLEGPKGCLKSADICKFAHWNTGWTKGWGDSKPTRIDSRKTPRYPQYDHAVTSNLSSNHNTKSKATMLSRSAAQPKDSADAVVMQSEEGSLAMRGALPTQSSTPVQCSQLDHTIAQIYNLDINEMFRSGVSRNDCELERRAMLLYHPEEHLEDLELITRWLLMHDVEVGSLWYDGAWSHFQEETCPSLEQIASGKQERSGVIIAHPDFDQFCELRAFGEVLKKRVCVWSVGLQPPSNFEPGVSPNDPVSQLDRIEIFPRGGFIYITDDVFERKPQLALAIVELFFAKIEHLRSLDGPVSHWQEVDDACLLWRLCVRPELMESLYQKCDDNAVELAAGNPDHLSRAKLYQLLSETNYIEQDHPFEDPSLIEDKYPILSERRTAAEGQPLDYFNRLANSMEDATTAVLRIYADLQVSLRRNYRHFYVVHTEPDGKLAQNWKSRVHTIAEVITPERCVEELSKASKESLFDFMDWAMDPKEGELGDAPMEIETVEHTAY